MMQVHIARRKKSVAEATGQSASIIYSSVTVSRTVTTVAMKMNICVTVNSPANSLVELRHLRSLGSGNWGAARSKPNKPLISFDLASIYQLSF